MRALVLAPHQDDEVLGCGGTVARLARYGHKVDVISFALKTIGHKVDPVAVEKYRQQSSACCKILGVADVFYENFESEIFDRVWREIMLCIEKRTKSTRGQEGNPYDLMFFPWHHDLHQDHRAVSTAARFSLRGFDTAGLTRTYMYACPGSTDHDFSYGFRPNVWVPLEQQDVDKKIAGLRCYVEEQRDGFHPRSIDVVLAEMRVQGAAAGVKNAEAFELYRETFNIE